MKFQPRARPPRGNKTHAVYVAIDLATLAKARELAALEYKKYYSFGHFVGELIREAVAEYERARKEQDEGGVHEDLGE